MNKIESVTRNIDEMEIVIINSKPTSPANSNKYYNSMVVIM